MFDKIGSFRDVNGLDTDGYHWYHILLWTGSWTWIHIDTNKDFLRYEYEHIHIKYVFLRLFMDQIPGSISGFCIFLSDNLVSWSPKRQTMVSRSRAEAEYHAVAHMVAECCWLRQLLQELHISLPSATVVYCDNISVVYMIANPVHHHRTKHIEINIHFVHEKVALGQVRVLHMPFSHQFVDIMTKELPVQLFNEYRSNLCVRNPPA